MVNQTFNLPYTWLIGDEPVRNYGICEIGFNVDPTKVFNPEVCTQQIATFVNCEMLRRGRQYRAIEVGSGSGAFSAALILEEGTDVCVGFAPHLIYIAAVDIDTKAVETTAANMRTALTVTGRDITCKVIQSDWLKNVADEPLFDVAYINPPFLEPGHLPDAMHEDCPAHTVYTEDPIGLYARIQRELMRVTSSDALLVYRTPRRREIFDKIRAELDGIAGRRSDYLFFGGERYLTYGEKVFVP